jgi:hypothetical protein
MTLYVHPVYKPIWGRQTPPNTHQPLKWRITVQKLIDAYRANPTDMNALKLAHHAKKHPMSVCMLTVADAALLGKARAQLAPIVAKLDAVVIGEFI